MISDDYADPTHVLSNTIYLSVAGSRAYGIATPASDTDRRGIFVFRDIRSYAGIERSPLRQRNIWPWGHGWEDTTIYECRHAMTLMSKGNISMLEMLYLLPDAWMITSPAWDILYAHRDIFLSRAMYDTCRGYAHQCIKRMHLHDSPHSKSKRRELVAAHGYDTKAAAHALRLMCMCRDLFAEGTLTVSRVGREADHLMAIRNGAHSMGDVMDEIRDVDADAARYAATCGLPPAASMERVEDLWMQIFHLQMGGAW